MAKCVCKFKDRETGEVYEIKDAAARLDINSIAAGLISANETISELERRVDEFENANVNSNILFKNEHLTTSARGDLPAPVAGKTYRGFVDGAEVGTGEAWENGSGAQLGITNGDYTVYICYAADMGGWYFHPMDSTIQSGDVTILKYNDYE